MNKNMPLKTAQISQMAFEQLSFLNKNLMLHIISGHIIFSFLPKS